MIPTSRLRAPSQRLQAWVGPLGHTRVELPLGYVDVFAVPSVGNARTVHRRSITVCSSRAVEAARGYRCARHSTSSFRVRGSLYRDIIMSTRGQQKRERMTYLVDKWDSCPRARAAIGPRIVGGSGGDLRRAAHAGHRPLQSRQYRSGTSRDQ